LPLIDFRDPAAVNDRAAIDDRVIGGISRSRKRHDPAGHAVFEGEVSLERKRPDLHPQEVFHRLQRRHRGSAPHPLRQHAPRLRQHLVGTGRTVLAIDIAHQQRNDSIGERSGRQRHGELRSVSGGIARDRSTTTHLGSQGSKTAAGRKRSRCERAELDSENGVGAWVDKASPPSERHRPSDEDCRHCRPFLWAVSLNAGGCIELGRRLDIDDGDGT
jgi:hypothetical protein